MSLILMGFLLFGAGNLEVGSQLVENGNKYTGHYKTHEQEPWFSDSDKEIEKLDKE